MAAMRQDLEKLLERRQRLVYLIHENVLDTPQDQESKFQHINSERFQFQ